MTSSVSRIVHYVSHGTPPRPTRSFFNQGVMQSKEGREGGTWHWPERV